MRIDRQQFLTEKAKFVPGFEPGPSRQNAGALPLAPPPLPDLKLKAHLVFRPTCPKFSAPRTARTSWRST